VSELKRSEGDPQTQLGRVAHAMTQTLAAHPEKGDVQQAIVLLHDSKTGTAHFWGYEQDTDALEDLITFMRNLGRAHGITIDVNEIGRG